MCNSCVPTEEAIRSNRKLYKVVHWYVDNTGIVCHNNVVAVFNEFDNALKLLAEKMLGEVIAEQTTELLEGHEKCKLLELFKYAGGMQFCGDEILEPISPYITYKMCKEVLMQRIMNESENFIRFADEGCDCWTGEKYVIAEFYTED